MEGEKESDLLLELANSRPKKLDCKEYDSEESVGGSSHSTVGCLWR
jgi:hypothetical protein